MVCRSDPRPLTRTAAAVAAVALSCISLAACAATAPSMDAADPRSIAERASALGVATELVYTTEVDGYDLAPQSVGAGAADGMTATWFNSATGAMLTIRTDRGEFTEALCAATPLWDAPEEAVACANEDGVWHRSGGDIYEYVAVRDSAVIWVAGANSAPAADVLRAAENVHVPTEAELDQLFADAPEPPAEPVERGDLPDDGDGAPIDPVGPGG